MTSKDIQQEGDRIVHLTPSLIGVTVPKDAKQIQVDTDGLYYKCDVWSLSSIGHIAKLPAGNWSIVGEVERDRQHLDDMLFSDSVIVGDYYYSNPVDENEKSIILKKEADGEN